MRIRASQCLISRSAAPPTTRRSTQPSARRCAGSSRARSSPTPTEWDEAGEFPRELYKKAAAVGLLQLGFPEEYGGIACDRFYRIVSPQELARAGCGGISASLNSHTIGAPPIARFGSEAMKGRVLPPILAGEKISALAITEPSAGSDVANLKTTARRDGDHFIVRGEKTFITSGMRADFITVAVRTGGARHGRHLAAADRARHAGLHAHAAEEDGLVGVRHRDACTSTTAGCRPRT